MVRIGWRAKAMTQLAFSYVPAGDSGNYLLQRYVTGSLPVSDRVLGENLDTAAIHLSAVRPQLERPLGDAVFYEFGAGWSLALALSLAGMGVRHQILVDVRPLSRVSLVTDAVERLAGVAASRGVELDLPPWPADEPDLAEALRTFGIDYRAPCDARSTGLPVGSVDVVTSTSTLEHIPRGDVVALLRECRRLLRADGVLSALVDYKDHYASFDGRLSPYHFLTFDERSWRWYSPPLHHQNRLRHVEYGELFTAAGFELIEVEPVGPDASDLALLAGMAIDPGFARFSTAELGVRDGRFLARPRPAPDAPGVD